MKAAYSFDHRQATDKQKNLLMFLLAGISFEEFKGAVEKKFWHTLQATSYKELLEGLNISKMCQLIELAKELKELRKSNQNVSPKNGQYKILE